MSSDGHRVPVLAFRWAARRAPLVLAGCLAMSAQAALSPNGFMLGGPPVMDIPPAKLPQYLTLPGMTQSLIISVNDPVNHVISPTSVFDGVAKLIINGGTGCSGALLSGGLHVLTAAHCLDSDGGLADVSSFSATFNLAGGPLTLAGVSYALAPGWTGDYRDGADIAIVTLAAAAPLSGYGIHTDTSSFDFLSDIAGYGYRGIGSTGYVTSTFGTLRAGMNIMDAAWDVPGLPFAYDFDDGSAARDTIGNITGVIDLGLGNNEVLIAPGDSGGPSFFNGRIVGVHSFIASYGLPYDLDASLNGTFGELGGDTRVAFYADWINSVLTPVPEPETYALFGVGLTLLLWRARRANASGNKRAGVAA